MTIYTRPAKESHRDTIDYEIRMLRFCARELTTRKLRGFVANIALEAFLLHYRNLVEVFSGRHHRRLSDLSVKNCRDWAGHSMTPKEIELINKPAIELDKEFHIPISQYLQHCTLQRADQHRSWPVEKMLKELEQIISAFERSFPRDSKPITARLC